MLHQNRFKGLFYSSKKSSITDERIPEWFDIAIWGHEHESHDYVEECSQNGVFILQPGSTVATSLIEAEAKQKHSYILTLNAKGFEVQPIPLKRIRPFLHRQIELNNATCAPSNKLVEAFLKKQVETLLSQHESEQAERMEKEPNFKYRLPLLRLKIEYSGNHTVINIVRFSEQFKGRIANRQNFLHFWRRSEESLRRKEKRKPDQKDHVYVYNHEESESVREAVNMFNELDKLISA